jgi:hypothetical protein
LRGGRQIKTVLTKETVEVKLSNDLILCGVSSRLVHTLIIEYIGFMKKNNVIPVKLKDLKVGDNILVEVPKQKKNRYLKKKIRGQWVYKGQVPYESYEVISIEKTRKLRKLKVKDSERW